jgi:hypothetical protein
MVKMEQTDICSYDAWLNFYSWSINAFYVMRMEGWK